MFNKRLFHRINLNNNNENDKINKFVQAYIQIFTCECVRAYLQEIRKFVISHGKFTNLGIILKCRKNYAHKFWTNARDSLKMNERKTYLRG